ncbi:MAG: AMP-binding protein [Acidimicrobiales bacterium]
MNALHDLCLGDVLRENARSYPAHLATICAQHRLTYPQLDDRVNRLANVLAERDVARGDRVLWTGQNCHRFLETLLAAAKLGAVLCPANWRQSTDELRFIIEDSSPKVVIFQSEGLGDVQTSLKENLARGSGSWICHDTDTPDSYEALVAAGESSDPCQPVDPSSAVLEIYTGAFAGRPNGALLSHTAIISQDLVISTLQRINSETIFLANGPLFHVATLMSALATFHLAGTLVFTRRSSAEEICRLIDVEHCTSAFLMPNTMREMIELNRNGRYDLSSLRAFPGSKSWNQMVTIDDSPWGRDPAGYGQTEVMGLLTFNAIGGPGTGTSGRPSPLAQVRIVDPDGREVPPGETGEIVCRGPIVMNGYHDREALNAQRYRGGWYHTGDLARREEDGSISFIAPMMRMIKSGAENIYPAEVEACIASHPGVKEIAIIGVPDRKWTQSVKAIVVPQDGYEITPEEIIEHCRRNIASYKKPRSVVIVDALPRKEFAIDYDALDEAHGGGGYPGIGSLASSDTPATPRRSETT